MKPEELNAWIILAGVIVGTIADGYGKLKAIFVARGLTEEQQNEILIALLNENARRRALSHAIAFSPAE